MDIDLTSVLTIAAVVSLISYAKKAAENRVVQNNHFKYHPLSTIVAVMLMSFFIGLGIVYGFPKETVIISIFYFMVLFSLWIIYFSNISWILEEDTISLCFFKYKVKEIKITDIKYIQEAPVRGKIYFLNDKKKVIMTIHGLLETKQKLLELVNAKLNLEIGIR